MKDVEVLLRGFAMLMKGAEYAPSMNKFLNRFSRFSQSFSKSRNEYLENLFRSFLENCAKYPAGVFVSARTKRFSIALYEAVFTAASQKALKDNTLSAQPIAASAIHTLDTDPEFVEASEKASADRVNVEKRLQRARALLL